MPPTLVVPLEPAEYMLYTLSRNTVLCFFVALGVDVGHVVADDGELLHVGFQARNGCVH